MKSFIVVGIFILCLFTACQSDRNGKISIAIVTPAVHPSLEEIEKGFIETIDKQFPGKYHFSVYNAQGNKTLLRSEIEEISNKSFELVLTIGASATVMTTEAFAKKGKITPVVFTAVNTIDNRPQEFVTGVKELLKLQEEIDALLTFVPDLSTLLLVYNPMEAGREKDAKELAQAAKNRGISLKTVEVFQTNELKSKTSPFIPEVDAVIVLKDNTVVSGIAALSKLCLDAKIPLMASNLDSTDQGASFAYGVQEKDFGIEAAKKALQILEEQIPPHLIPITPVENFTLRVNFKVARLQSAGGLK